MIIRMTGFGVVMAVATSFVGWVAVPVVGALMGVVWQGGAAARWAAGAGALGWTMLLVLGLLRGPVLELATLLGGMLGGMPGAVVVLITVMLPALLAGAAAGVTSAAREMRGGA
jgi:hypothetical protein